MTPAELAAVIEAEDLLVEVGCDLFDADEASVVEDITGDLVASGSSIARDVTATIHGTGTVVLSRELLWTRQRIRLRMRLSSETLGLGGTDNDWSNLGVYVMPTPERVAGESPSTWTVDVYDKLQLLAGPRVTSYTAPTGSPVVAIVAGIITAAGESKVLIDQANQSTLPTARSFLITEDWSDLAICNELLRSISYDPLWVDPDGYYRSGPHVEPSAIAPSWTFDSTSTKTTLGEKRSEAGDSYDTPNVWVFLDRDPLYDDGTGVALPTEGAGIYTVTNQSDGPTSIDGRAGRVRGVKIPLDCAGATVTERQASLVSQGDALVAAARKSRVVNAQAGPMPTLWHQSTVTCTDPGLNLSAVKFLVAQWSLPFDGTDMTLTLKEA